LKRVEHIWFTLFDRRGGRAPDELDDAALQRLGMLVGRLHDVGARGSAVHRMRLTSQLYARDDLAWLADHRIVPERLRQRYHDAAGAIADRYDELAAGTAEHRLHGDLHLGNVLLRDGRLRLVDFDDMMVGPAVQDVWLAVPGRDAESLRQRAVLLAGYEQFRLFDHSTFRLIEPLRGLRMIHYAAWLARRWHDPIFQATWRDFGTEAWWEREVEDLEEQLRVIRREAAGPMATAEEDQALTNRDYFWDWDEN
jgi:Ser/Thr protein kinase RdoA (MazF antagonist)